MVTRVSETSGADVSSGRLFPHLVCRVAGLPGDSLADLRAAGALEIFDELLALEDELKAQVEPLTEILFEAISGQDDITLRRALLRLKRDVHNLRASPAKAFETAAPVLAPASRDGLTAFHDGIRRHTVLWESFRQRYSDDLTRIRRRFQERVANETFLHGLLLSSRSLSDRVPHYRRAAPDRPKAKARQVERSLMRYYSRTVMKATPFSTLCSLLPGRLRTESGTGAPEQSAPSFDGSAGEQTSRVRLNKSIYARIVPQILNRPAIRRQLCVELNPTLERDTQASNDPPPWVFLTAQGAHEVFQRLAHPVVDLIQEWLATRGPSPLHEVVSGLAHHPDIDTDEEQAEAFIEQLLKLGLLRFRLGIAEQEVHWDAPLRALLQGIDDPVVSAVETYLAELRTIVDGYAEADLDGRRRKLERSHQLLKEFFAAIDAPAPKPGFEAFYEDAGGRASLNVDVGPFEDILAEYIDWTSRLAWPRGEQANMRHFFDTYYGDEASVPLLRFYEDYFREHFKEHLAQGQQFGGARQPTADGDAQDAGAAAQPTDGDGTNDDGADEATGKPPADSPSNYNPANPFDLDYIRHLDMGVRGMQLLLQQKWRREPEAEVVHLGADDLAQVLGHLPPSNEAVRSSTLFVQYLHEFGDDGSPALVARSYLAGYGKYFSRFLYLLPPEVQRDLLEHNSHRGPQLAEICGDANFNANLHPPLVPWELSYPTGESGAAETQIRTSDVDVEIDPTSPHRLRLRHRTQDAVVVPLDLGFLNPRMRPPLFQMLTRFAPADNFTLMIPELPEEGQAPPPVLYRPRIVYRRHLILARRQWRIASEVFPTPSNTQGVDYFERMQRWRRDIGLPDEVFVRIHVQGTKIPDSPPTPKTTGEAAETPEPQAKGQSPKASRQPAAGGGVREHLYKPQYIDFANPLLVELLGRGTENLSRFYLAFEECLPSRRHFLQDAEHPYATELILQMDLASPDGGGAP